MTKVTSTYVVACASWSIPGSKLVDPRLAWTEPRLLVHSRCRWP